MIRTKIEKISTLNNNYHETKSKLKDIEFEFENELEELNSIVSKNKELLRPMVESDIVLGNVFFTKISGCVDEFNGDVVDEVWEDGFMGTCGLFLKSSVNGLFVIK